MQLAQCGYNALSDLAEPILDESVWATLSDLAKPSLAETVLDETIWPKPVGQNYP